MTGFWVTLLIGLPLAGVVLGLRMARTDQRTNSLSDSVLRDIDIENEAEKDNDE